jgi:membrane protease YdiL (CAAX protease family)
MGQSHREIFLVWGNWRVPTGLHLLNRPESLTWAVVGPSVALGLAIFFGWGLVRSNLSFLLDYQQLILRAHFVLLFALMNAFGEEMTYRAGPLSQLWPVVGERQAIWITAVWFGLGHYYGGIPSGAMGALMAGGVALLFGKAMVETRGIALSILMHTLVDVAIYAFLALTAP